jgi:hypothetical protein
MDSSSLPTDHVIGDARNLCGALQTGRHVDFTGRSTNDLLVSILNLFGYDDQSFGWAEACDGPPGLA